MAIQDGPLLWVGLGNPGSEHARQRHNIGFMALDEIARRHRFSPWRKRFKGEVSEGTIAGRRVWALKPMTYMNASGDAVQQAASFLKLPVDAITAFHDELDLAPGKVRVKKGGGVAGHNGLRDMRRAFASAEFWRVRLGIGHPGHKDAVIGHGWAISRSRMLPGCRSCWMPSRMRRGCSPKASRRIS